MSNQEIRESGVMPDMIKAMEHDPYDLPQIDIVETYKAIEDGVVGTYKAIEDGVVGAYKAVENTMVDVLFRKEGETVEEAKERLRHNH